MTVTSTALAGVGASCIAWSIRAVAMNNTTTIKTGIIVQANSICVLPYTWAGSLLALDDLARNLKSEYTSKVQTTAKMIPVMASTKSERCNMDLAGVD